MRRFWIWLAVAPVLVLLTFLVDRDQDHRSPHVADWLQAGDARVRAVRAGKGDTTLLLLHGFGESLFTWRALVDPLAERARVLAIDLPGFGGSDKPDASYSLDAMTGRLTDLIDHSTNGPIVVIGHSMGGEIAAALALARPDRVAALVLIAPAGWGVGLGGIADTMYSTKAKMIGWYLSSRAFLLPEHDPAWLEEPKKKAEYTLIGDPLYRQSAARVLGEFDFRSFRARFSEIEQPVLVLWGGLDPVIPFVYADSVAHQFRCGRLVAFPTALHRPQVEIPDQTLAAIDSFLTNPTCSGR